MNNSFEITVLADGKISVKSTGGFAKEIHADADDFLAMMKELSAGSCETKKLQPSLGNPHSHQHNHGHHHSH